MIEIVLMLHPNFLNKTLQTIIQREDKEDIHLTVIPDEISKKSSEEQVTHLKATLPDKIDLFFIEANYGSPGDPQINSDILKHCLLGYDSAKIIVCSSTVDSLVNAASFDPKIRIWKNGSQEFVSKEDMKKISSKRYYNAAKLRFDIENLRKNHAVRRNVSEPVLTSPEESQGGSEYGSAPTPYYLSQYIASGFAQLSLNNEKEQSNALKKKSASPKRNSIC